MNELRTFNTEVNGESFFVVGFFDDEKGNSTKFYFSRENKTVEKYVFVDDELVSREYI